MKKTHLNQMARRSEFIIIIMMMIIIVVVSAAAAVAIYIIILLVRPYAYARSACAVRKHKESHAQL